jgi:hypothetical protein
MKTHLPVVGSTAKTTAFCHARLEGPGGLVLHLDGNGKVTAGNGTLKDPKPNALSLPSAGISGMEHCPQSTETCRKACYVENLKAAQPDLYALYEENAATLRAILNGDDTTPIDFRNAWAEALATWIYENADGGFRWHVSGDVVSFTHAMWIADVCRRVQEKGPWIRLWIYTRSFDFLAPLVEVSTLMRGNLAVNLSADKDNWQAAVEASLIHGKPGQPLRVCYLTVDGEVPGLRADDVVFPDYNLRPRQFATLAESPWWQGLMQFHRGLVCPVDAHGKDENRRCGPCNRCLK